MTLLAELTAYYAERPRVYGCVRVLIQEGPAAPDLRRARDLLGRCSRQESANRARGLLEAALGGAAWSSLAEEPPRLSQAGSASLETCWCRPNVACVAAYRAAGMELPCPRNDVAVMAVLSDATRVAIEDQEMDRAASLIAVQASFLSGLGASCLLRLAEGLGCCGAFYGQVGASLAALVAGDLSFLGEP